MGNIPPEIVRVNSFYTILSLKGSYNVSGKGNKRAASIIDGIESFGGLRFERDNREYYVSYNLSIIRNGYNSAPGSNAERHQRLGDQRRTGSCK